MPADHRRGGTSPRPEIPDGTSIDPLTRKARFCQAGADHLDRPAVVRRHRTAGDEPLGEIEGLALDIRHGVNPAAVR